MNKFRHIIAVAAVLLAALSAGSCVQPLPVREDTQLMVSLYIPDIVATKAGTGWIDPAEEEKRIDSLQIWVFLTGENTLVTYKNVKTGSGTPAFDPDETGLLHAGVTRIGMDLTPAMFSTLSSPGTKVDVYAVANAVAGWNLDENTSKTQLEALVLADADGLFGGTGQLTVSVPASGLPMSGVLKEKPVTGGYPVLSISTLSLTRAVSKIRFVFVQQASPTNPAAALKTGCQINRIVFDGTEGGADCQIAKTEKLFTQQKYGNTNDLFDVVDDEYTPLSATIQNPESVPVVSNEQMARSDDPERLSFRSTGHETETAQEYESRIDAVLHTAVDGHPLGFPASQVGPVYIRETAKRISGVIYYSTGAGEKSARFSMEDGEALTRNHSWLVFGYFAEETGTLHLTVSVLDWTYEQSTVINFEYGTVNVIRRFTAMETDPATFKKEQTDDGFFDVTYWHTLYDSNGDPVLDEHGNIVENVIKGDIIIATPIGAKLHAIPVPGADGVTPIPDLFTVEPESAVIYPSLNPNTGTVEDCKISYTIRCNKANYTDAQLEGQYFDLHFCVEIGSNDRWIDLGSESLDYYRFILKKQWNQ